MPAPFAFQIFQTGAGAASTAFAARLVDLRAVFLVVFLAALRVDFLAVFFAALRVDFFAVFFAALRTVFFAVLRVAFFTVLRAAFLATLRPLFFAAFLAVFLAGAMDTALLSRRLIALPFPRWKGEHTTQAAHAPHGVALHGLQEARAVEGLTQHARKSRRSRQYACGKNELRIQRRRRAGAPLYTRTALDTDGR